jgi:apolipoprotein N-acyltransferase
LPPEEVRAWCKREGKYVLAGGVREVEGTRQFYDTAFVVGPSGEIVFEQAKAVPIQFMADGLPAPGQKLWESPWGEVGVCVCYDLSYTRVVDRLAGSGRMGMLVVPAMDAKSWGAYEHGLHARVGPVRAVEYGIPVVRVCSSGISQIVSSGGQVRATAGFPGQGERVVGAVSIAGAARMPVDRWVAPGCAVVAVGWGSVELMLAAVRRVRGGRRKKTKELRPATMAD